MSQDYKRLYRSRHDRMITGVCGGLGEYFDIDPTLVRLIFVFGSLVTSSGLFWIYLIMAAIVPLEPSASEAVVSVPSEELPPAE